MKKYLISYGDDAYASQKIFFRETAVSSSFFDDVVIFTPNDIDPLFAFQAKTARERPRGGGYWIWKPYFVKKAFDRMDDNDVLVYCDAGCMINSNGWQRFEQYISILEKSDLGIIGFELPHQEIEYTKKEVFDYFDVDAEIIKSNQIMATVFLLKKCDHTRALIDEWYTIACHNPSLFTDELDGFIQYPEFIDHRHDQSIWSVIRKIRGAVIIPDETYFLDFLREGQGFPFWATRLKG